MATTATSNSLKIGDAFGYVFRSRNWFGKILVGTVCLIFGWLILPALILTGYQVAAARSVSQGQSELPPWSEIGRKLGDGFLLAVVHIVWAIPIAVIYFIGFFASGCSSSNGTTSCTSAGGALFFALAGLLGLVYAVLSPAMWAQFMDGGLGAALQFGTVFRRAFANLGTSVVVVIMAIVAGILAMLGIIAVFIGLLITIPWAYYVQANLFGQFARVSRSDAQGGVA